MKGYCARCNRERKKGDWIQTEIQSPTEEIIQTSRGQKLLIRGTCPDCGCRMTVLRGIKSKSGADNEDKKHNQEPNTVGTDARDPSNLSGP